MSDGDWNALGREERRVPSDIEQRLIVQRPLEASASIMTGCLFCALNGENSTGRKSMDWVESEEDR